MARLRGGRVLLLLPALVGVLGLGVHWAMAWWDTPLTGLRAATVIEIQSGDRIATISQRLAAQGTIDFPLLLTWQARLRGLAGHIRAGEYEVHAHASPHELIGVLVSGKVLLHPVTLVEGWTAAEALDELHDQPFIRPQVSGVSAPNLRQVLAITESSIEGQLFPDTYLVPKGTSDVDVMKMAHARMTSQLSEAWAQRAEGLPLATPYQALILASIIEKETGTPDERARIASVFVNRLRKGMRLQTDPTVIYGLGDQYNGTIHKKDLTKDTPWNTYTRDGLPPTPIAMPGVASINAALHPAHTDALYFVASGKGDGRHTFSATLAAHNAAVAGYVASKRQKGNQR